MATPLPNRATPAPIPTRGVLPPIASLGNVELVTFSLEREHHVDRLTELAYRRADKFVLVMVEAGSISVAQRGRQCRLQDGQYALLDCSHPLTFGGAGEYRLLALFIPAYLLKSRLRNAPHIVAQPMPCTGSPWRIASNLLRLVMSEIRNIPIPMAYGYATQIVELVSIAVEADTQPDGETSGRTAIFRRCAAYMRSQIADPGLDPARIAAAMGISVRYLHKIFHEEGESVCDHLRDARLDAARKELSEPRKANVQIREIAHRVGFRSQAHFAAAFRQQYGVSATEHRKAALEEFPAHSAS